MRILIGQKVLEYKCYKSVQSQNAGVVVIELVPESGHVGSILR
jgi:hypothetical protein